MVISNRNSDPEQEFYKSLYAHTCLAVILIEIAAHGISEVGQLKTAT
jgi:hypothetical protein